MINRKTLFCLLLCVVLSTPGLLLYAAVDVNQLGGEPTAAETLASPLSFVADQFLVFFQKFISPVDDRQCIFSPTCSAYARKAIAKYGFFAAYPLIAARLIRCNASAYIRHEYEEAPEGRGGLCYDPVP